MKSDNTANQGKALIRAHQPTWFISRLIVIGAAVFVTINVLRTTSPLVVVDEFAYLINGIEMHRATLMREFMPTVPRFGNFLFLREIKLLSQLRVPVDQSVKLLNVIYLCGALGVLAMLARRKAEAPSPLLYLTLFFYPIGSYAVYIMPECAYFLTAVILFAVLIVRSSSFYITLMLVSLLAAVLTLIKPHGLFVFLALQISCVAWHAIAVDGRMRDAVQSVVLSTCVYAIAAWGLNRLLAPASAPRKGDVVGSFYWDMLLASAPTWDRIQATLLMVATIFSAILFMLAPAITFLVRMLLRRRCDEETSTTDQLHFTAFFLLVLIALIVVFSSYIIAGYETDRVHFRYLSFALPVLIALSWILSSRDPAGDTNSFRHISALVWFCSGLFLYFRLPDIRLLPIDAPELFFAYADRAFIRTGLNGSYIVLGLTLIAPLLILSRRFRWFDVQLVVLLLLVVLANWNTYAWINAWSRQHEPLRRIGDVAKVVCGGGERDILALGIDSDFINLYYPLAGVGRAVPLRILATDARAQAEIDATPAGTCILTTLVPRSGQILAKAGNVSLVRANEPRS